MVKYVGNIATGKLHIIKYADKRCKLEAMREENKKGFDSLDEAMQYPDKGKPIFRKCAICFKKAKGDF